MNQVTIEPAPVVNMPYQMTPSFSTRPSLVPMEHEMMTYHVMAENAVASRMYRGIGEKAGVLMIMLAAREMNVAPMMALNGGLNIINGKVEISARLMAALIRRAGHSIQEKKSTDEECVLVGKRMDNGDTIETSFLITEAQRAGLIKEGGGWKKWPKDMLYARALSRLARRLFPDIIGTSYVEGEIQEAKAEVRPVLSKEEIAEAM